jgi:hypothetical protein
VSGVRCSATAAITSATPVSSAGVGIWRSTSAPITVAVAGSSANISENVARGRRAIANWLDTYGITEEQMPTPIPASSSSGAAAS